LRPHAVLLKQLRETLGSVAVSQVGTRPDDLVGRHWHRFRDVENTLADALGAEAALSKSTVSRICQAIGVEFTSWSSRRLDGLQLEPRRPRPRW
jgi:hypothetical protein